MPWGKKPRFAFDPLAFEELSQEEKLKVLTEFIRALDESIADSQAEAKRVLKAKGRDKSG